VAGTIGREQISWPKEAEQLHFHARGTKPMNLPTGILVPTIFHTVLENGMQHFVVVYKISKKKKVVLWTQPSEINAGNRF
jgi:hypothetical protein